jgi:glutaminase
MMVRVRRFLTFNLIELKWFVWLVRKALKVTCVKCATTATTIQIHRSVYQSQHANDVNAMVILTRMQSEIVIQKQANVLNVYSIQLAIRANTACQITGVTH